MAIDPRLLAIIQRYAPRFGLDPRAAAAISMNESGGRFGAVGDSGTSFGPWQLHVGGALPAGRTAAWANSLPGILYALRTMSAAGARGLHGQAAVNAIARNFERPANPGAEVATAMRYYSTPGFARGSAAAGAGGGGGAGGSGASGNHMAALLAAMQPMVSVPQGAPLPTALGALQQLLAAHAAPTPAAPPQFLPSMAPQSGDSVAALNSLHSSLLPKVA